MQQLSRVRSVWLHKLSSVLANFPDNLWIGTDIGKEYGTRTTIVSLAGKIQLRPMGGQMQIQAVAATLAESRSTSGIAEEKLKSKKLPASQIFNK